MEFDPDRTDLVKIICDRGMPRFRVSVQYPSGFISRTANTITHGKIIGGSWAAIDSGYVRSTGGPISAVSARAGWPFFDLLLQAPGGGWSIRLCSFFYLAILLVDVNDQGDGEINGAEVLKAQAGPLSWQSQPIPRVFT